MEILGQVKKPKLVALDTMNYWIESTPGPLREVIGMVDIVVFNEGEIREISGEYNLVKAARAVMEWGPSRVVIKRGETLAEVPLKRSIVDMRGQQGAPVAAPRVAKPGREATDPSSASVTTQSTPPTPETESRAARRQRLSRQRLSGAPQAPASDSR